MNSTDIAPSEAGGFPDETTPGQNTPPQGRKKRPSGAAIRRNRIHNNLLQPCDPAWYHLQDRLRYLQMQLGRSKARSTLRREIGPLSTPWDFNGTTKPFFDTEELIAGLEWEIDSRIRTLEVWLENFDICHLSDPACAKPILSTIRTTALKNRGNRTTVAQALRNLRDAAPCQHRKAFYSELIRLLRT